MTDLISTPPAPSSPDGSEIVTGAWWPNIDVNALRDAINLKGDVPDARMREAIRWGVITVQRELADWTAAQVAAGKQSLITVDPADQVDGKTRLELLFLAAVGAHAAARLMQRNPDISATREGSDRGDQRRAIADDFLADATRAVRDITGETRTTVELI